MNIEIFDLQIYLKFATFQSAKLLSLKYAKKDPRNFGEN